MVAKAITQSARSDDEISSMPIKAVSPTAGIQQSTIQQGTMTPELAKLAGTVYFVDAAWKPLQGQQAAPAGIGIFIQNPGMTHCSSIYILAMSPLASSALQAEALGIHLAIKIAELLCTQQPVFLTDNKTLALAAATNDPDDAPGHWQIAPQLAAICSSSAFSATRIFHISRHQSFKAHHQAKLALRLINSDVIFRCLCNSQLSGLCPVQDTLSELADRQFKLLSVKCC
jgi:hypothetical protein